MRQPPAGPAGPIGKQKGRRQIIADWYAAHDRPAPQMTFTSGVPRVRPILPIFKTKAKRTKS